MRFEETRQFQLVITAKKNTCRGRLDAKFGRNSCPRAESFRLLGRVDSVFFSSLISLQRSASIRKTLLLLFTRHSSFWLLLLLLLLLRGFSVPILLHFAMVVLDAFRLVHDFHEFLSLLRFGSPKLGAANGGPLRSHR